jgi:hypothetical protein
MVAPQPLCHLVGAPFGRLCMALGIFSMTVHRAPWLMLLVFLHQMPLEISGVISKVTSEAKG